MWTKENPWGDFVQANNDFILFEGSGDYGHWQ